MALCGYNKSMLDGLKQFALGNQELKELRNQKNTMGLCGYNKQMLEGEAEFGGGLWVQLEKRSKEERKSLIETLQLEIEEMENFEKFLRESGDIEQIEDVLGIVYFARSLYRQCLKAGGTKEAYEKNASKSIDRQFEMDKHYYGVLRPLHGPVKGLQELAVWLQEHPLSA